jgi:single-stranded DNA-specific DHH superfamily exonuclease
MITEKQLLEELETCKKPLFFFHDDSDGVCSFLLLYRKVNEGKGVVVKASDGVNESFIHKVEEYQPDKLFILDLAVVAPEFIKGVKTPIIWIDHHPMSGIPAGVKFYNPRVRDKNKNIPVTKICYDIVQQDLWIAGVGVIGDWVFIPEIMKELKEKYPELLGSGIKTPEEALFNSKFGELAKIFTFVLKGKTSDVNKCINILTRLSSPEEVLGQKTSQGKFIHKYYEKISKPYAELLKRALSHVTEEKLAVFSYTTDVSFTSGIANEVMYRHPDKVILVAREKSGWMRCSLRTPAKIDATKLLSLSLVNVDGKGGGHEHSCGVSVRKEQWETFIQNIKDNLKLAEFS